MSRIFPTLQMLQFHTNLNITSRDLNSIIIKPLSTKEGKQVWRIFLPKKNNSTLPSSIILKASNLPQSMVETLIYNGSIDYLKGFTPIIYGQWQEGEFNWVALEDISILSKVKSFKELESIIKLVANLHSQFPSHGLSIDGIPLWRNLDSDHLKGYFDYLTKRAEGLKGELFSLYRDAILKGMRQLPQLLNQTKQLQQSLIHGDLKPINIGLNSKGLVLIDWEDAQIAPAVFDVVWLIERAIHTNKQWIEEAENLRLRGITVYIESLHRGNVSTIRKSFLLEYKLMYIYLVLTSIIWNYCDDSKKSTKLEYHLRNFSCWGKELGLI